MKAEIAEVKGSKHGAGKKIRTLLSMMLVLFLAGLFVCAPTMQAQAEETGTEGTVTTPTITPVEPKYENDAWQIGTAAELYWFAGYVNGTQTTDKENVTTNAVLTANIVINNVDMLNADGTLKADASNLVTWVPIGNSTDVNTQYYPVGAYYTGNFDGQGYSISGLYYKKMDGYVMAGLFGGSSGTIKGVQLLDSYLEANSYTGGICAYQRGGKIMACYNEATVTNGICDTLFLGTISNCYNAGNTTSLCGTVGSGVVQGTTTIQYCATETALYSDLSTSSNYGSVLVANDNSYCEENALKSGEVTYLLNGNVRADNMETAEIYWYQTLVTDTKPVFMDNTHGRVYVDTACENNPNLLLYTNEHRDPHHEYTNGYLCDYCHDINPDKLAELVEDDVWQIDSAEDLYYFADYFNNYVYYESEGDTTSGDPQYVDAILLADIDLNAAMAEVDLTSVNTSGVLADTEGNAVDTSAWKQWTPIGKNRTYTGTFDGNGHVISHLFINQPESSGLALVCSGGDATVVKNLGIRDSFICGTKSLAAIKTGAGTVTNCFSNCTIVSTFATTHSTNELHYHYVGGIANGGVVKNSYCYGRMFFNPGTGGQKYNVGPSTENCFYVAHMADYTSTSGNEWDGGVDNADGITAFTDTQVTDGSLAHMLQQICLEGEQYWSQGGAGYPVPVAGEAIAHTYDETTQFCCCGAHKLDANIPASYFENAPDIENSVYQISNAEELYWFAGLVNGDKRVCKDGVEQNRAANAVLTADITVNSKVLQEDMTTVVEDTSALIPWIPIGSYEYVGGVGAINKAYTGTFDGQGYSISGLYLPYEKYYSAGLFGSAWGGTVQRVVLRDSYFTGTNYVGGISGYLGTIQACYSEAMVEGEATRGGLIGYGSASYSYYAGKYAYAVGTLTNVTLNHCASDTGLDESVESGYYYAISNCIKDIETSPVIVNGKGSYVSGSMPTTYTIATEDILASGELAYILNSEVGADANDAKLYWYQKIDTDKVPTLTESDEGKVYATTICPGRPNLKFANEAMEAGEHVYEDGFFCKFCDELNEEGTFLNESGIWQIGNAETLQAFVKYVNKSDKNGEYINAVLTSDIDLNPDMDMTLNDDGTLVTTDGLTQWVSIGSSTVPYEGTFDGQGYSISHLYLNNDTNTLRCAMFGECDSEAVICNLGLLDSYISNSVSGCVASFSALKGSVQNCYSTAVLRGKGGGSYSIGYSTYYSYVYGITAGTAENCYFAGKIYTTYGTQAYCGSTASSSYTINCYSTDERYYNGEKITTKDLCTVMTAEQITNGALAHALQMGSDENTWSQGTEDYPVPVAGEKLDHTFSTETGFCLCGATKWDETLTDEYFADAPEQVGGVYQISNAAELFWFAGLVNGDERVCTNGVTKNRSAKAVLTNDIIINGEASILNAAGDGLDVSNDNLVLWTPIGLSSSYSYAGTFDGQGYTISGLVQPRKDMDYAGLFGYTTGVIQNVTVTNSYIVGGLDASTSSSAYVGGICGYTTSNISKAAVTNSYIASEANAYVGGIAGYSNATVTACYSDATVSSGNDYFGGLCGRVSTIWNSYYAGTSAKAIYSSSNRDVYCASNTELGGNSSKFCCLQNLTTTPESFTGYNCQEYTLSTDNPISSGELVYLLNGKVSAETENATLYWYQKIGEDVTPTLKVSEEGKVYAVTACPETTTLAFFNESKVLEHTYSDGYICDYCYRIDETKTDVFVDTNEDGTLDTWQIGDAAGLYAFNKYMNNYCSYGTGRTLTAINVELTADIDMNPGMDLTLDEATKTLANTDGLINWTPFGTNTAIYAGTFDGQGHTISHLYVVKDDNHASLIGRADNATIKNVSLKDSYIYGKTQVGSFGANATIENCFSDAILNIANGTQSGGIGHGARVSNSCYTGTTYVHYGYSSGGTYAGISNNSSTTNCYYEGTGKGFWCNSSGVWTTFNLNGNGTAVTTDQLSSGEVTYLLNESSSEAPVWYQTLGEDAYPVLDSTHGTVYSVFKCDGTTPMYRNVNENASCVDEDGDGICDVCASGMHGVSLAGHNLVLGDLIAVNFYFELDEKKDFTDAYVELSKDGAEPKKVLLSEADTNTTIAAGKTYYVFTYEVAAKEMEQEITAAFYDAEADKLLETTYSVAKYAEDTLDEDSTATDSTKDMVKAMITYGNFAEAYFGEASTDIPDTTGLEKAATIVSELSNQTLSKPEPTEEQASIQYAGCSLILLADTTLRVYFEPAENVDLADVTFTCDSELTKGSYKEDGKTYYYADVTGIKPKALSNSITVTASANSKDYAVTLSPMFYVKEMLGRNTTETNLVNLLRALYAYYEQAVSYNQ